MRVALLILHRISLGIRASLLADTAQTMAPYNSFICTPVSTCCSPLRARWTAG